MYKHESDKNKKYLSLCHFKNIFFVEVVLLIIESDIRISVSNNLKRPDIKGIALYPKYLNFYYQALTLTCIQISMIDKLNDKIETKQLTVKYLKIKSFPMYKSRDNMKSFKS